MTGRGRPIRFLAFVAVGWIGVRVMLLWPQAGSLTEAIRQGVPLATRAFPSAVAAPVQVHPVPAVQAVRAMPILPLATVRPVRPGLPRVDPERVQMALLALVQYGTPAILGAVPGAPLPVAAQPDRLLPSPSRWSASAWLVARAGTGLGAAPGGSQLGGGQAGVRVAYMLFPEQRIAAIGRVTAPLRGRGAEASLGIEWQPGRAPLRLVAEHRFGLDGTKGGPGIGAITGFDGAVARGFRLESYGQAGLLRRARTEPYADGAVRITRAVAGRLALGAGAWGAVQRDAARLDIGPSATLALPVGGQNVRLALDWRQRVAGDARPGSGLALTLGSDF
ncbi:hypothetical protein RZN05_15350 [Sphingomonas sp. HF-S4]|uniref:Haemolysin activator HlyB C-terminal domain-containing protein n=1 Tax=Sphingomonas agrestis TaxID=3080540 RepID=A0ABU3YAE3_9SPHN|nr:hypothetical protein [Sphingomonas sp. HF-S4]MDV3458373.1 hypothetical protein [Sphingomonas sp. HF-S4]